MDGATKHRLSALCRHLAPTRQNVAAGGSTFDIGAKTIVLTGVCPPSRAWKRDSAAFRLMQALRRFASGIRHVTSTPLQARTVVSVRSQLYAKLLCCQLHASSSAIGMAAAAHLRGDGVDDDP